MALEEFKRIQDLKSQYEKVAAEYRTRYTENRRRILDEITNEAHSFFTAEGFQVVHRGAVLSATYGGAQLTLEFPSTDDDYMGAISVLSFKDSRRPSDSWTLTILEGKDTKKSPRMVIHELSNDEGERLKHHISELQSRLHAFKPMDYSIMYYRSTDPRSAREKQGPIVTSITAAIKGIVENKA